MALSALTSLLGGGGGLSAAGGILSGLGSLFGGNKQEDAAEDMLNFAKNMQSFVHDLGGRQAKASRKDARKAARDIGKINTRTRDQELGIAGDLRGQSLETAEQARRRNMRVLRGARNEGMNALAADRDANISDIRGDRAAGLSDIARNRGLNMATARGEKNASLGYFEPAIGTGQNALSAISDTLGLSNGGFNMALTPATRYLMEQGRTTVEGGAAGAGGLYSGETLGSLEEMRMGLAAQDRDTQLAQLLGLVGVGQSAGNSAAGVRSDFRNAATGIRNDATQAQIGLRDATTGQIRGARGTATAGSNALLAAFAPQIAGVNDTFAGRADNANTNFANMSTNAVDTAASRGIAARSNLTNQLIDSRNNAMNAYIGAMSTTSPMVGQGITNKGDAGAAGIAGLTRGVGNALGDYAYWQGQQGGGLGQTPPMFPPQPLDPGWTGRLY